MDSLLQGSCFSRTFKDHNFKLFVFYLILGRVFQLGRVHVLRLEFSRARVWQTIDLPTHRSRRRFKHSRQIRGGLHERGAAVPRHGTQSGVWGKAHLVRSWIQRYVSSFCKSVYNLSKTYSRHLLGKGESRAKAGVIGESVLFYEKAAVTQQRST